jgi:hypothetical protein
MDNLTALLEPLAAWFRSLGIPEPITHWGHPVMMGTVVFVMGSFAAVAGWRGRIASDEEVASQSRATHRKIAPWMFLFMAMGYTGGILSLVMQKQPILESPHFWTGTIVLSLLGLNGAISLAGFGGKESLRTFHAYLGSAAFILLIVHAFLGLNLGLSI